MELDELKQQWKKTDTIQSSNQNIMEMIRHRSNGPVAALKQSYRRQMTVMIVVPIAILLTNFSNIEATLTSALFWSYVAFCAVVVAFARLNYHTVEKLEGMDEMVRSNLEKQITILETRVRQNVIGIKFALLFFVVLTEALPYIQHFQMLDTWHSLSPVVRFGAYALLFLLQHYSSRRMSYIKFGKHIERLKELVRQMQ